MIPEEALRILIFLGIAGLFLWGGFILGFVLGTDLREEYIENEMYEKLYNESGEDV